MLLAASLAQESNRQLRAVLESMRSSTSDPAQSADSAKTAVQQLRAIWPQLQNFSVERLAWEAASQTYQAASEAKAQVEAAGGSAASAQAAADAVAQAAYGMSQSELAAWLAANEPAPAASTLPDMPEISDEMLVQLLKAMPDNSTVIDEAIALVDAQIADTDARLAAYQADPDAADSDLFLLDLLHAELSTGRQMLELIGPVLDGVKAQLDSLGAMLQQGRSALEMGLNAIGTALAQLSEQEKKLPDTRRELEERKAALERQYEELEALRADVDDYEHSQSLFYRERAVLLSDEGICTRVEGGGELFAASDLAIAHARLTLAFSHHQRIVIAWLTVAGSICGLFAVMGAFEKPRYRFVWLPTLLCISLLGMAEILSWQLGRGLLYSAAGTALFALLLLPLSIPPKKKA